MGMSGSHHAPAALTPQKFLVPTEEQAGWAPQSQSEYFGRGINLLYFPKILDS